SCHPGFIDYKAAVIGIDEWIRRMGATPGDNRRMPQKINNSDPDMPNEDREVFDKWRADGLIKDDGCEPTGQLGFLDVFTIGRLILADLSKIDKSDQIFIRYAVASDLHNQGDRPPLKAKAALDKALNSIVEISPRIT